MLKKRSWKHDWWLSGPNSKDGAWDVDIRGKDEYRNRKSGFRIFIRGLLSFVVLVILYFTLTYLADTLIGNDESRMITYLFIPFRWLLYLSLFGTLQIPIGLYYFVRYFKVE